MTRHGCLAAATLLLCAGCTTPPEKSADADYQAPKVYRTGSNIPVKDYGAENVEVTGPNVINPMNRPLGSVGPNRMKPGG